MLNTQQLSDFHAGTTKRFWIGFKLNGEAQDITPDTMTIRFKANRTDPDSAAVIEKTADVSMRGVAGQGYFSLSPSDTNVTPGNYHVGIELERSNGDEYVLLDQVVEIKDRVADIS